MGVVDFSQLQSPFCELFKRVQLTRTNELSIVSLKFPFLMAGHHRSHDLKTLKKKKRGVGGIKHWTNQYKDGSISFMINTSRANIRQQQQQQNAISDLRH